MNTYAYKPRKDGSEPVGGDGRIIRRDLKTEAGRSKSVV